MVKKWLQRLGLNRYEVVFSGLSTEDTNSRAWVHINGLHGVATVELGKFWQVRPTRAMLEKTAFHECFEILLAEIANLASRAASDEEITFLVHQIIRSAESLFFRPKKVEFADEQNNS